MIKKPDITLIISIFSIVTAALALCLSFIVYSESKAISFLWKVDSQNGIPIKLKQEHYKDEQGKRGTSFYIPIWLEFKIVNGNPQIRIISNYPFWPVFLANIKSKPFSVCC